MAIKLQGKRPFDKTGIHDKIILTWKLQEENFETAN
jgi:hypothetical protein